MSHHGRKPDLYLRKKGESISLREWSKSIFADMYLIAEYMDSKNGADLYVQSINKYSSSIESIEQTLSAKILDAMRDNKMSYYQYIESLSKKYCQFYSKNEKCQQISEKITRAVETSLQEQKKIEESDTKDFAKFLEDYFSQ